MKRDVVLGFTHMQYVDPKSMPTDRNQVEIDKDYVSQGNSPDTSLLRLIYSVDERTKVPTGDLTYYVSDKANPEIKQYILNNLMMDTSSAVKPAYPAGIPDDVALSFERMDGESLADYAQRMNTEVDRFKWLADEYKRTSIPKNKPDEVE